MLNRIRSSPSPFGSRRVVGLGGAPPRHTHNAPQPPGFTTPENTTRRPAALPLRVAASRSHLDLRTAAALGRMGETERIGLVLLRQVNVERGAQAALHGIK